MQLVPFSSIGSTLKSPTAYSYAATWRITVSLMKQNGPGHNRAVPEVPYAAFLSDEQLSLV